MIIKQITINKDENQYRICGYENEIIKEIVKATQCQVHVNRFIKEKEMTAASVITALANVSLKIIQILIMINFNDNFFYQESDIYLYELGVLNKRFKLIDYLSVNYCINWFSILGVEKPLNFHKTKILSIFDLTSWLLLFFSLIILSILNTKYKRNQNVILTIFHSWFNHLELISKSGKLIMISL